ncbi:MAG: thioredoxin domain-containing protein [Nanoarchaeota archaeon]
MSLNLQAKTLTALLALSSAILSISSRVYAQDINAPLITSLSKSPTNSAEYRITTHTSRDTPTFLQSSSNLTNWNTIAGTTNIGSSHTFIDTPPKGQSQFYRLVTQEKKGNLAEQCMDGTHVLGNPQAPITFVEFSDFQSPYSRKFYEEVFPRLKEEYIDTGKAKYIFCNFPLEFYPQSQTAALAAECVFAQGGIEAYERMKGLLYTNALSINRESVLFLADIALQSGQIQQSFSSGRYAAKVSSDIQRGIDLGVQGTPTFFINNKRITGAQPYHVFKETLNNLLNSPLLQ